MTVGQPGRSAMPGDDLGTAAFQTKTGVCRIEADRLVLARQGPRGLVAQSLLGSSVWRALAVYAALGVSALAAGAWFLVTERGVTGVFFCALGVFLLGAVVKSRNNTAVPEIARADIVKVEASPPRPGLTRGTFTVHYRSGASVKQRLIMLPGSLSGGTDEYQRAVQVLTQAGLLPPAG